MVAEISNVAFSVPLDDLQKKKWDKALADIKKADPEAAAVWECMNVLTDVTSNLQAVVRQQGEMISNLTDLVSALAGHVDRLTERLETQP